MGLTEEIGAAARLLGEAVAETLWPTRCAVCDLPGEVLCPRCRMMLPYLDQLRACPTCGASGGWHICCECNSYILKWKDLKRFPLEGCVSATVLTPETRRIVTTYKDRGDRALARVMADCMANVIPPAWLPGATLVPIPARKQALRQRGFDHIALITKELQAITQLQSASVLVPRTRRDQRALDARQRLANMRGSLVLKKNYETERATLSQRVILVDDVLTTGATLFTAADVLHAAGATEVFALTFARV